MAPEKRDLANLQTISLLIERIRAHLTEVTVTRFADSDDDIDLLACRLSMIGLRNIVAHEYRRVTPSRIWDTATKDLDGLEQMCRHETQALES
jgi:uncharacterized protein with HEPN domain